MNLEDIKIGETYYVRVKADSKNSESVYCQLIDADGNGRKALSFYDWMLYSFLPVPPATKYDPCREFRAGDKVGLKTNLGRNPYDTFDGQEYIPDGTVFTVLRDEWAGGKVDIFEKDESDAFTVHFSNLELVTPVEELEPYSVHESEVIQGFDIVRDKLCVVTFPFGAKECGWYYNRLAAEEAAEAECKRLNAEYRKEQK